MPLALARMKRIWVTKSVGEEEEKKKPGKKGTQLVLLFLLADKKWIIHSKGVSGKNSYYIKTRQWH